MTCQDFWTLNKELSDIPDLCTITDVHDHCVRQDQLAHADLAAYLAELEDPFAEIHPPPGFEPPSAQAREIDEDMDAYVDQILDSRQYFTSLLMAPGPTMPQHRDRLQAQGGGPCDLPLGYRIPSYGENVLHG